MCDVWNVCAVNVPGLAVHVMDKLANEQPDWSKMVRTVAKQVL
jgi:hypothetical protein